MKNIITSLNEYEKLFPEESFFAERIIWCIEKNEEKAFHNYHWDDGHITGSMLIINKKRDKVLLMFHKKLQKWLQFWWHSDDSSDILGTAIREFHEESGILESPEIFSYFKEIAIIPIFDIDIHEIPADAKGRPLHLHYDIRFLGIIDDDVLISHQVDEVDDIRWFSVDEINTIVSEMGTLRMIEKIKKL